MTTIAVGTAKGLFLLEDGRQSEPIFPGERVPSLCFDQRHGRRMFAGTVNDHFGPLLRASDDGGRTWSEPEVRTLRFPEDTGASLEQVWQIVPAGEDEPDVVYAGVEPAALFRSEDGGQTWELNRSLWQRGQDDRWQPGGGGLGLHTILLDPRGPERLHVAISAGGTYRTEDGGQTWQPRNMGLHIPGMDQSVESQLGFDESHPEVGPLCVHKLGRDAADPARLYMQYHGGLFRTDDDGGTWTSVADRGTPSDFGFPLVAHPRRANTAYLIPLTGDYFRCVPDGAARVYRTTDAGESWEALSKGLPAERSYLTILRDAFCHDGGDPLGLYFGTRTGQVYGSDDEGESWSLLADQLPPVLCVRAVDD